MKHTLGGVSILLIVSCSPSPAAVQPSTTAPVTPAAVEQAAQSAPSVSRADALIEDMRRREAAQATLDRESPPPPAPRLDLVRPSLAPAAAMTASTTTTAPAATSGSTAATVATASASTERDEQWWKNEMRAAQVRLSDNTRRLQESRDQQRMAQRQMEAAVKAGSVVFAQAQEAFNRASAEVRRLEAEASNDAAAVERIREDARRASVPPGWLRWP